MATEPITHQPTCDFVSPISSRTIVINGAMPNQAKKQRKNAIHDMWKARICGVEKLNKWIRVALPLLRMSRVAPGSRYREVVWAEESNRRSLPHATRAILRKPEVGFRTSEATRSVRAAWGAAALLSFEATAAALPGTVIPAHVYPVGRICCPAKTFLDIGPSCEPASAAMERRFL